MDDIILLVKAQFINDGFDIFDIPYDEINKLDFTYLLMHVNDVIIL